MLVNVVSREDRHALASCQVFLVLHFSSLIILFVWLSRALKQIILEDLFIMNGLGWIEQDHRRLPDKVSVTRFFDLRMIKALSEALNAVKPSGSSEDFLPAIGAFKTLRLASDGDYHFLSCSLLEIV